MDFKVGDLLRGREAPFNPYGVTNRHAVVKVLRVHKDGRLDVEVIEHDTQEEFVGDTFIVVAKCFEYEDKEGAEYGL